MSENKNVTGARYIADTITALGIDHVHYFEASMRNIMLELEKQHVTRIVTRSEKSAVYMADGYARMRKGPAFTFSQSVGAANIAAGLLDPFLGHTPVVAITGKQPPQNLHRHAFQEADHTPMFAGVTKYQGDIVDIQQLPYLLPLAIREATGGCPAPVHLDIAGGLGEIIETASAPMPPINIGDYATLPTFRPGADPHSLKEAMLLLRQAKRPIILAGGGAALSGASKAIVALAEKMHIPVGTSANGKGCILETHPLSIGVVGFQSRPYTNNYYHKADLVLVLGSQLGGHVTLDWSIISPTAHIIQVDINSAEIGLNYPVTLGIQADIQATVTELAALAPQCEASNWSRSALAAAQAWRAAPGPKTTAGISPFDCLRVLNDILPDNGVFVTDTGNSAFWGMTLVEARHPNQRFIRSTGSLGWGFPSALGVKAAAKDRPVVCFTGDGGYMYHLSDLETAARWNIKTITIVNNNSGFAQCKKSTDVVYAKHGYDGRKEEIYSFRPLDHAAIARDFGCVGLRLDRRENTRAVFAEAFKADKPVVIDLVTDIGCWPEPAWSPK